MMVIPIIIRAFRTVPKDGKGTGRLGNRRTNRDHPDYSIIKIGQNTWKSLVTQTPVRDHQLTLVWKTLKEIMMIITSRDERKKYIRRTRKLLETKLHSSNFIIEIIHRLPPHKILRTILRVNRRRILKMDQRTGKLRTMHDEDRLYVSRKARRVDLEGMAMKVCSAFPKAPALLEPHHQID